MAANPNQPITLDALIAALENKVISLKWRNGEVHTIRISKKPPSIIRASYYIKRPEEKNIAFVSDALLVSCSEDGQLMRLTWPSSAVRGRGAMYPFIVYIPLTKGFIEQKRTMVRANLRSGNATEWDEMVAWEVIATIEEPSED